MQIPAKALLFQLLHYHQWRVSQIGAQLRTLSKDQLRQPTGGSFGSLEGLLQHLIYVDYLWLQRVQGLGNPAQAVKVQADDVAGYLAHWEAAATKLQHWLARTPDDALLAPVAYQTSDGTQLQNTPLEMFLHLVDHDSFHTGQITHVLRDLGLTPVHTNWLYYYLDKDFSRLAHG